MRNIVSFAALVITGVLAAPSLLGQSPAVNRKRVLADRPAFEVASVKLNKTGDPPHYNFPITRGANMRPVGGLFSISSAPLRNIIAFAYDLNGATVKDLMPGLPSWVNSERFDIEAKAEGNPTKDEFRLMVQSILADRFMLATHHETRQIPVFAVVLSRPGKSGPQLTPHTDDTTCLPAGQATPPPHPSATLPALQCGGVSTLQPSVPGRLRMGGRKVTLELLVSTFTGYDKLDRPFVDRTGLAGTFDFWLEFTPLINGTPPAGFQPDPSGASLQEALQEQLGLKLESQTVPLEVMVVDRLEQPSEN